MKTFLTVGALVVLLVGIMLVFRPAGAPNVDLPDDAKELLAITPNDHISGDTNASTTLIEYSDLQCPACRAYAPIIEAALAKITATGSTTVRFVYRHFPLTTIHPKALPSAYAAEAAGMQGKFFEMAKIVFEKQDEWAKSLSADELFAYYAKSLNLDAARFAADMKSPAVIARVEHDQAVALKLGLNSTPTFFINGKQLAQNPRSVDEFVAL